MRRGFPSCPACNGTTWETEVLVIGQDDKGKPVTAKRDKPCTNCNGVGIVPR